MGGAGLLFGWQNLTWPGFGPPNLTQIHPTTCMRWSWVGKPNLVFGLSLGFINRPGVMLKAYPSHDVEEKTKKSFCHSWVLSFSCPS